MKLHAVGLTDIGNVREENQDSFTIQIAPCSENGNSLLAVVADGVGGAKAGNVASKIAVEALKDIYLESAGDPQNIMRSAIETANMLILEKSSKEELCRGMATTCTAMLVKGDTVIIGHVGDSRAYRIRDGEILQMTEDQTLPRRLFREGLITEEEIEQHPQGSVLTNAVGSRKIIDVDINSSELMERDTFVLCSDGLYKYLNNEEIRDIVSNVGIEASPEKLVAVAKERGGDDNITVVVVQASSDRFDKTTEILSTYEETVQIKKKKVGWKMALSFIIFVGFIAFVVNQLK